MPEKPPPEPGPELDLSPYEGCWVALVRGQVCGVGQNGRRGPPGGAAEPGPRGADRHLCSQRATAAVSAAERV